MKTLRLTNILLTLNNLRTCITIACVLLFSSRVSAQNDYQFSNGGQPTATHFVVDPTDDATFDFHMNNIVNDPANKPPGPGIRVTFNGTFTTGGLWGSLVANGYEKLYLQGYLGNTNNTIKLKNSAIAMNDSSPEGPFFLSPIFPVSYVLDFKVQDLTVDCNWANQTRYSGSQRGFKSLGINSHCYTGYISRAYVKNFGANGGEFQNVEAFAIALNSSDVPNGSASLTVTYSAVSDFTSANGGYCTGIILVTGKDRTAITGTVSNCNVWNVSGGIAYGTGADHSPGITNPGSSYVQFYGNRCNNCRAAFNCDAQPVNNIDIFNNVFSSTYGINVGATGSPTNPWYFTNFSIYNNYIGVTGPISPCTYTYGIRLAGGNNYFTISGNTFGYNNPASYTLVYATGQNIGGSIVSDWYPTTLVRCD